MALFRRIKPPFSVNTLQKDSNCILIRDPSALSSMYQDRAGTTLVSGAGDVVGKMLDLSGEGNHSVAPSDAARPTLKIDANGKYYLERDLVDDNLPITWATNLTSTGVIYTATGEYTTKDSGLVLSGATDYKQPKYDYGRIVMAADSKYDAKIIKYLDAKRGGSYQLGPEKSTYPGPYTATTGWSGVGTSLSASGGLLIATAGDGSNDRAELAISGLTSGSTYLVTVTAKRGAQGTTQLWQPSFVASPVNTSITSTSLATMNQVVVANATSGVVRCYAAATGGAVSDSVEVSAVSVREIIL